MVAVLLLTLVNIPAVAAVTAAVAAVTAAVAVGTAAVAVGTVSLPGVTAGAAPRRFSSAPARRVHGCTTPPILHCG